jgi:uncharacterized protein (TIGR03435 family)
MRLSLLLVLATASLAQEFEVASIKPSDPNSIAKSFHYTAGLRTVGSTLRDLIVIAYDVRPPIQIQGGPSWIDQDRYDVTAKVVSESDADPSALSDADRQKATEQTRLRTRALLADRFKPLLHKETRELPLYTLTIDKSGIKPDAFRESKRSYSGLTLRNAAPVSTSMISVGSDMSDVAALLAKILDRPVVDRTGLTARYEFTLKWAPEQTVPLAGAPLPDSTDPSIFTALREQLGLRLESTKGPLEILVIDRAEKPSAN